MMPRNPESVPSANAETADGSGMRKARQRHEKRGDHAVEAPRKARAMPRCLAPRWSRCGCSAMKYSSATIGIAAASVDSSDVAERVVILLKHREALPSLSGSAAAIEKVANYIA